MGLFVDGLHAGRADVRVDLRRAEALVAEQFLNAADVGAAIEQVGGETVPQGVRSGPLIEARSLEVLFRSEEHTSELQSQSNLVCRLLLEKKKKKNNNN